jgi:hypothetical protein
MKPLISLMLLASMLPGVARAQAGGLPAGQSDCLNAANSFVGCIQESPQASTPEPLVTFGSPLGNGVFSTMPLPPTVTLLGAVVLFESKNAVDATTLFFNGIPVSDVAVSFVMPGSPAIGVNLISDGHPDLPAWVAYLNSLPAAAPITVMAETGAYQDVTQALHTPYNVQIASDVEAVPEPTSYSLLGLGLGLLATWVRRQRRDG